jgi:membrane-associated phospholipid phosphatase
LVERSRRPRFYRRWLSPERYLLLHLAAGFVLAMGAGIAFDLIEDKVFSTQQIRAADAGAQRLARAVLSPRLTGAMRIISFVGNPEVVASLSIAVTALLIKVGSRRRLYAFVATVVGGALLLLALKQYYHRERPTSPFAVAHGYSFPSGHAMGAMLLYGSLAYVAHFTLKHHRVWRMAAVVACILMVIAIGASRIYLGVHYFTDVVGGFAAGLCWAAVCFSGTEAWAGWRDFESRRKL